MKNHTKVFCFMTFHKNNLIVAKPLRIRFDKIDVFIRVYGTRYLLLFGFEKYGVI